MKLRSTNSYLQKKKKLYTLFTNKWYLHNLWGGQYAMLSKGLFTRAVRVQKTMIGIKIGKFIATRKPFSRPNGGRRR